MDVRKLQLPWLSSFLAVADAGSMTAAAAALHLSQPRISAHVAALEAVVGAPLFERGARGVTLTPLGARFVPRARRVFDELRSAADELDAARDQLAGRIRIGSYPGASAVLVAPVLARYRERYSGVDVDLFEGDAARLHRAVSRGRVDFAIRPAHPPAATDLPTTLLCREKIVVVTLAGRLVSTDDVSFLGGATVIVSGDPQGGWADYRDRLDELGIEPAQVIVATMPTTLTAFVRARLGIGIMGAFAAHAAGGDGTATRELPAPLWRRDVQVVHATEAVSPPVAAFLRLLHEHGPGLTEGLAIW